MKILTDPNDKYEQYSPSELIEFCGLIPAWFGWEADDKEITATEVIDRHYGFGRWDQLASHNSFSFNGNILKYDGDPDMHPYVEFEFNGETVGIYPYAWVKIGNEVARID